MHLFIRGPATDLSVLAALLNYPPPNWYAANGSGFNPDNSTMRASQKQHAPVKSSHVLTVGPIIPKDTSICDSNCFAHG